MTKYNFEICFICRYPTTDWSEVYSGEKHCGACLAEGVAPSEQEQDLVYAALQEDWHEADLEDFYHQMNG
jgi:hypothetical protein